MGSVDISPEGAPRPLSQVPGRSLALVQSCDKKRRAQTFGELCI